MGGSGNSRLTLGGTLTLGTQDGLIVGRAGNRAGTDVVSAPAIVNNGVLSVDAEAEATGAARIAITGTLTNNGLVDLISGTVTVGGAVLDSDGGAPAFALYAGARLQFGAGVAVGEDIRFEDQGGATGTRLVLGDAPHFQGLVDGSFGGRDTIDVLGFGTGTTVRYTASGNAQGTLAIDDGSRSAAIAFRGSFEAAGFSVTAGGNGDSIVSYAAPADAAAIHAIA